MRKRILRVISLLFCLGVFSTGVNCVSAADVSFNPYMSISYDGGLIAGKTFYNEGTIYIPLRMVSQMTGHAVIWDDQNKTISIVSGDLKVGCNPFTDNYDVNNKNKTLGRNPVLIDGTTYVPVNFIGEILDMNYYETFSGINILEEEYITIQVEDTSLTNSNHMMGDWVEGQSSITGLDKFYITSDTEFKNNIDFEDIKSGDVLEAEIRGRGNGFNTANLGEVTVKSATSLGLLKYSGEITSVSSTYIKIKLDTNKTTTLNIDDDTQIKVQGKYGTIDIDDLEKGMYVYGTYSYNSTSKGNAVTVIVGDEQDYDDLESGDTVYFNESKITSKGNGYIYIDIDGDSIRLSNEDTTVKDYTGNGITEIDFDDLEVGDIVYGSYEYISSTRGIALKLNLVDEYSSGYDEGDIVYEDDCEVTKVTSSYIKVEINGVEYTLYFDSSMDIYSEDGDYDLSYKDISVGDNVSVEYKYTSAFKGDALQIILSDYGYYDTIYFDGYIDDIDLDDDYVYVDTDDGYMKLAINEDTVVYIDGDRVYDATAYDFKNSIDCEIDGSYEKVSSNKGIALRLTVDSDYAYQDSIYGEVIDVSSSYIKVDDYGDTMKIYVDDDTIIKRDGKTSLLDIDDIYEGDYVDVDYYKSSSKYIADRIVID